MIKWISDTMGPTIRGSYSHGNIETYHCT